MSEARGIKGYIIGWLRYLGMVILSGATLAGFILVFFDLAQYLFSSSDFTVQEVSISDTEWVDKQDILARAAIAPGSNIWMVDLDTIRANLVAHPVIREAQVQRVPPRRIHLTIEERLPVAYIHNKNNGLMFGLDKDSVVLPPVDPELIEANAAQKEFSHLLSHPVISGLPSLPLEPGAKIESDSLQNSIKLIEALRLSAPGFYGELAEAQWHENGNLLLHPRRRIGVLVLRNDFSESIAVKINALWNAMETENLRAIYVDARFPENGFAVRWDESEGQEWKRLYQQREMAITNRPQNES